MFKVTKSGNPVDVKRFESCFILNDEVFMLTNLPNRFLIEASMNNGNINSKLNVLEIYNDA